MLFGHFRRKKIIRRIREMEKCEKCSLLEELAEPFGYRYHCRCGFFSSTVDAWQKAGGYTWAYDYLAPGSRWSSTPSRCISTTGAERG